MKRYSSALVGAVAAVALAGSSVPTEAGAPQAAPAVMNSDQSASIHKVGGRDGHHGGYKGHRSRGDDDFRFGFSLGAPFAFGAPYAYHPRPRAYPVYQCPYGTWFDGRYCVQHRYQAQPYYHRAPAYYGSPGFSIQLGF